MRLIAGAMLLVGLAFIQAPGQLIADTKFDLAIDPGGFLARAAHLWDPDAAFGQLQNQAYGYWWPMGPFFWVFQVLGAEGWIVQRLWIALVLVVAFLGATLITRRLGVRSDLGCLVAGAAFALSPRMVSIVGGVSIEAWPSALAPWVLLPLVIGASQGSPRRAAALSALAVGAVGGVNAAATVAVLPLGVVWLLTREAGPRRRSMMLWWPVFTFLATAWWLVPLFVLAAYSPPFLDWIESASVTTFPTTPFNVLRGTSAWIPYVDTGWLAGNDLLRQPHLIINSGVLLVVGFAGLLVRRNPHRVFLVLSVVVGLLLVSVGHVGGVEGWFGGTTRDWLDGALAPLRNVHKFDPVVRLPLTIGLAWSLEAAAARPTRAEHPGLPRPALLVARHGHRIAVTTVVLIAVLATASPAALGRLAPEGATAEIPGYWSEAAQWLGDHSGAGTALLVPGSSFGDYVWGSPHDEPMQFLASSSWAVRNAVPLAPAGNIRMLDAVEDRFAQGQPSTGLADHMERAGIGVVVVRNDLARGSDVPDPVLVHRVLEGSPGIAKVAEFGPVVGGGPTLPQEDRRVLVNGGWQSARPALEVYTVNGGAPSAAATSSPATVMGGPEDLLSLADLGVLGNAPTLLAPDADTTAKPPGTFILTDGLRDRERFFGRIHDATSPVRSPGQPLTGGNPTRDYLVPDADRWSTIAVAGGNARPTASSSAADATVPGGARRGFLPYAAVDGDSDTSFRSSPTDDDPWWRFTLTEPTQLESVQLTGGRAALLQQRVLVRTDRGVLGTMALGPGQQRSASMPEGDVSWIEVRADPADTSLDLAEVSVPGLTAERWLRTPQPPPVWGSPDVIALRSDVDRRTGCTIVDGDVRCSPEQAQSPSEEPGALRRVVSVPEARRYPATLRVRAEPRAAERLLQSGRLGRVGATSRQYPDARASAVAAVDGDGGTTWLAAEIDHRPALTFSWLLPRRVHGIQLRLDPDAPGRAPTRVRIAWDGGRRSVLLDDHGRARFRPFRTNAVSVTIQRSDEAVSLGFDGEGTALPVGVTEARLLGIPEFPLPLSSLPRRFPCGSGPGLVVNGRTVDTRVTASDQEILEGRDVVARTCRQQTFALGAGTNRIVATGDRDFLPSALVLGKPEAQEGSPLQVAMPGPARRTLDGAGAGELAATTQNSSSGWRAAQGGTQLLGTVADGWRQAWWSTSSETIRASFAPDPLYRWGMLVGGLLAAVLLGLLGVSRRWGRDDPPLGARRPSPAATLIVGVVLAGVLSGWWGAGLSVAWVAVLRRTLRASPPTAHLLCVLVLVPAIVAYAAQPWTDPSGWAGTAAWPDYLTVLGLVGAAVCMAPGRALPRSRRAGRSTAQ